MIDPGPGQGASGPADRRASFRVDPERSGVVLIARSTTGPITFAASGLEGSIRAEVTGGTVSVGIPPAAQVRVPVDQLTSGNPLYDAELRRRIEARRFPAALVELRRTFPVGATRHLHVEGNLTFHGVTRSLAGTVACSFPDPARMVVEGEQMLDMREFGISPPVVAMLRIYPDIRVQLHLEADAQG